MATYHVSRHTGTPSKPEAIALQQMDILRAKTSADPIPIIGQHQDDTRKRSSATGPAPTWPYREDYPVLGRRKA